jgi:hypothetical protein
MPEVFKQFTTQKRRQTLLNGSQEPIEVFYASQCYIVPGMNEVKEPNGYHDDTPSLMLEGEFVPGTMVFTDLFGQRLDNQGERILDSANAVQVILGIDAGSGNPTSKLYDRGLTLLPPDVKTRAEVEVIRESARARATKWRITQAREIIQAVDARNRKLENQGLPPVPGGPEYVSAIRLLSLEAEQERKIHEQVLGMTESTVVEPVRETPEEDADVIQYITSKIDAAAPDKTADEKTLLVERILKDPEALKMIDTLRKRRKAYGPNARL